MDNNNHTNTHTNTNDQPPAHDRWQRFEALKEQQDIHIRDDLTVPKIMVAAADATEIDGFSCLDHFSLKLNISTELSRTLVDELGLNDLLELDPESDTVMKI